jgi:hypothetical protein
MAAASRIASTGGSTPRYLFKQVSSDIRELFCESCDRLGIKVTSREAIQVSVARAESVRSLDAFVGPKS